MSVKRLTANVRGKPCNQGSTVGFIFKSWFGPMKIIFDFIDASREKEGNFYFILGSTSS